MNEQSMQWDARERAGLLAREDEERRGQRRVAEDPGATAAVLTALARQALEARTTERFAWFNYVRSQGASAISDDGSPLWKRAPWRRGELLFQALAAHPNTPPALLAELIGTAPLIPQLTRAFFRNPVAPFLLLEHSTFLKELDVFCQLLLLREADTLPRFVERVAESKAVPEQGPARAAAQMHIAIAGEVADDEDGYEEMRFYRGDSLVPYSRTHQWQANLLPEKAESPRWTDRTQAASLVDATNTPMEEDFFNRSGLDLLHLLTGDGNRFVRWTARTRLAQSDTR